MKLSDLYFTISPKLEKLYVVPSVKSNSNEYLELLYEGMINESNINVDSLNRFEFPKLFFRKILGENSILHYHWFEVHGFKNSLLVMFNLFCLILYRIAGGKIVWTIHNIYPHNKKFVLLNKILRIILAQTATKIHVHCNKAVDIMSKVLRVQKDKFFVLKHPDYIPVLFSKEEAVSRFKDVYPYINIDFTKKVFLVFGQMAEYKGIKELLEIITSMDKEFTLILAGKIKNGNDHYSEQITKLSNDRRIIFINKFIESENLPILFNLVDVVLFNYLRILTSGGVVLALNYNKFTIAPDKACISDIKDNNLHTFNNSKELKLEILQVLENE